MGQKPNAVVYVTRAGLATAGKKIPSARLPLPKTLVNNLEVLDVEKLTATCEHFFSSHGMKGKRVVIVLGLSVMFEKLIALDKQGNPGALTQAFVAAMPFDAGQRACLSIDTQSQLQLYATNVNIYATLEEALRLAKARVIAVTPAHAYHLDGADRSFDALAAQFMHDTKVCKTANLQEAIIY